MTAIRIAFWTFCANILCDLSAWAWLRYQHAKLTHEKPMEANHRYLMIHRWARAANDRLNAARRERIELARDVIRKIK